MFVTCAEMAEAERCFFAEGRSAEPYMEEAGRRCAATILEWFPDPARLEVYCGQGNNAGDALVVARCLKRRGWQVALHFAKDRSALSPLAQKKLSEYEAVVRQAKEEEVKTSRPLVIVDGLLGIGSRGPLRGPIRELARKLNQQRLKEGGTTFAIDLPSGLDADTGIPGPDAVVADVTLSITAPKTGFVADAAIDHLGRLVEIPLEIPVERKDWSRRLLFPSTLRPRLPRRRFSTHKGEAGRVVIAAGSKGFTGAALLSALGASRGGAGLVTLCVPEAIYPLVAAQACPEVMVTSYQDFAELEQHKADVYAVGPGLGEDPAPGLLDFLLSTPRPVVVDADALNALSRSSEALAKLPAPRLLTPHPGEMARLLGGELGTIERGALARRFADERGVTLLLKGARTVVASPERPLEFNTSGHPGMASGGMGDVLTGLCAAWVAQGLSLHDAACVGSWLLGRAAELAAQRLGVASAAISAPQVGEHLGAALLALETPNSP